MDASIKNIFFYVKESSHFILRNQFFTFELEVRGNFNRKLPFFKECSILTKKCKGFLSQTN